MGTSLIRTIVLASCLGFVGCAKSKPDSKAKETLTAEPTRSAPAAQDGGDGDEYDKCYAECLVKGPDGDSGKDAWSKVPKSRQEDDCTELCTPGKFD